MKNFFKKSKCALIALSLVFHSLPIYADDDVATDTLRVQVQGEKPDGFLEVATMMFFGFTTSRAIMACKPIPTDVAIAAAAGITYTVGEIYAWDAFKKIQDDKLIEFEIREDLKNDAQLEMLKELKKSYDEIAKTAKYKMMIQQAAAAGYGVAAIWALTTGMQWSSAIALCSTCSTTATATIPTIEQVFSLNDDFSMSSTAVAGKLVIKSQIEHKVEVATVQASCKTALAESAAGASNPYTASVCGPAYAGCKMNEVMCETATAVCTGLDSSLIVGDAASNSFSKFAKSGIKIPDLTDQFIDDALKEESISEISNDLSLVNFIEKSSPFYKMSFDVEKSEDMNSYMRKRDHLRFINGEVSSASISQYRVFKNENKNFDFSQGLKLALEYGIDLLIPSVQADSFGNIVGGLGGVGLAMMNTTSSWIHSAISQPKKRSVIWAIGTALATVAFKKTEKIMKKAKRNSEKLARIITELEKLNGVPTESGEEWMDIPTIVPENTGNEPLNIATDSKVPCSDSNKTARCKSIQKIVRSNVSTQSIPSVAVGSASEVAQIADELVGRSSIPGKTVDGLVDLSRKNVAIQNELKDLRRRYNREQIKKNKPRTNFDKITKAMMAKLTKRMDEQIQKNGTDAFGLLAKLGSMPKLGVDHEDEGSGGPSGAFVPDDSKNSGAAFSGHSGSRRGGFITGLEKDRAGFLNSRSSGFRNSRRNGGSYSGSSSSSNGRNSNGSKNGNDSKQPIKISLKDEEFKDIVRNKNVSIFTVISVRYLRSAFPTLLED